MWSTEPAAPSPAGRAGEQFSPAGKQLILGELADLPPVRFVADPRTVIVGEKSCGRVVDGGVLISLGPISEGAERVTVPNTLFFPCLGGQWLTYVLERSERDRRVVGTEGPIGIS